MVPRGPASPPGQESKHPIAAKPPPPRWGHANDWVQPRGDHVVGELRSPAVGGRLLVGRYWQGRWRGGLNVGLLVAVTNLLLRTAAGMRSDWQPRALLDTSPEQYLR